MTLYLLDAVLRTSNTQVHACTITVACDSRFCTILHAQHVRRLS